MSTETENNYLITGGTSDIGQALVQHLQEDDRNRILLTSRSEVDLAERGIRRSCEYIPGIDLTSQTSLDDLQRLVASFFTRAFTVIHCVGDFWHHKPITDTPIGEAERMMLSHYCTSYGVIRAVLPIMVKLGGGRILAMSCNSVQYNYPDMAAFTCAKAAVECLVKCTANEYSKYGIVVNALALSTIRTPKVEACKPREYHDRYITNDELITSILEVTRSSSLLNGNVIRLLKHSESYYHEGYFRRNRVTTSE